MLKTIEKSNSYLPIGPGSPIAPRLPAKLKIVKRQSNSDAPYIAHYRLLNFMHGHI